MRFRLQNTKAALLFFICLGFIACNKNELDRKKATELVQNHFDYPNVETIKMVPGGILPKQFYRFQELTDMGLIEFKKAYSIYGDYDITFTPLGQQYVVGQGEGLFGVTQKEVVSNVREFDQITGIQFSEEGAKAKVDFQTRRTRITPFGRLKGYQNEQTKSYSVEMALYDDGWRIEDDKPHNLKPDQFSFLSKSELSSYEESEAYSPYPDSIEYEGDLSVTGEYAVASFRLLQRKDLAQYNASECRLMRNEIFARHGYRFKSKDMQEYFNKLSWYQPQYENVDHLLTDIEKANIKAILAWEESFKQAD